MTIQKQGAAKELFKRKPAGVAIPAVENFQAYGGSVEPVDETESASKQEDRQDPVVTKVTARIPLYTYAFIEVEVTGSGAIDEAIRLTKEYGEASLQSGQQAAQSKQAGPVLFNGVEVSPPAEYLEALEGYIVKDNRGLPPSKSGKKRPDFVISNGVNEVAGFINTHAKDGKPLAAPRIGWMGLRPAFKGNR